MAVKKARKKKSAGKNSKRSASSRKGPKYVCVPCGTEVVITSEGAAFVELVCCGKSMIKK